MKYCIAYPYLGESREHKPKPYAPSALDLLNKACHFFGYTLEEISIQSRKRQIVQPRQMVMAAMWHSKKLGLASIGELMGGRDHTTVIHAREAVKDLCETDFKYQQIYDGLVRYLNI